MNSGLGIWEKNSHLLRGYRENMILGKSQEGEERLRIQEILLLTHTDFREHNE